MNGLLDLQHKCWIKQ